MAKTAIDGGKVECNGDRCKSSREIEPGMFLTIRQGWDEKTVMVKALSDKRGSAPQAALLYEETAESIAQRERQAEQRRIQRAMMPVTDGRPTKQDRRRIHRFKRDNLDS